MKNLKHSSPYSLDFEKALHSSHCSSPSVELFLPNTIQFPLHFKLSLLHLHNQMSDVYHAITVQMLHWHQFTQEMGMSPAGILLSSYLPLFVLPFYHHQAQQIPRYQLTSLTPPASPTKSKKSRYPKTHKKKTG